MTASLSSPSSKKRMSIRFMFALLSVVVLISFGFLAAVTVRGFGTLAGALAGMNAMYRDLSSQSSMMEIHAWEAQKELLDAAYEASIGAPRDEVERHVGQMEKALVDAREIMITLLSLEELRPDQFETLDEIYASFEAYASPFAAVSMAFKGGTMPAPGDIGSVDASFTELAHSLDEMNTALRDDAELRNAESKVAVRQSYIAIAAGIALSLAFLIAVLAFTMKAISRGIAGLGDFISSVGGGDLRTLSSMEGKDEFGTIAASVNGLVIALRQLISDLKQRLDDFSRRELELVANIEETGATVVQINGNVTSNGRRLGEEVQSVASLSTIAEENSQRETSLGDVIRRQIDILSSSASAVEQLIASVDSVARSAQGAARASSELKKEGSEGKSRIRDVNESVQSIERVSINLGAAVKIIQDIAERTNLLAMNAAIEAAHAGDSGRGFAVVASEIRKLAEQASSQAKDISHDLGMVSSTVDGVRAATQAVTRAFASIVDKTAPLDDEIQRIGEAVKEQGASGAQLLGELGQLRAISADVQSSFGDMEAGNDAFIEQLERLKAINGAVFGSEKEIASGTAGIQSAVQETIRLAAANAAALDDVMSSAGHFVLE